MRLIDADAGVDLLRRMAQNYRNIGIHKDAEDLGIIAEMLDKPACFPTIDAAPVVHARWGNETDDGYTPCTNCGWKHPILDQKLHAVADAYCPHCGAKMDGGESDGTDS